MELVNALSMEGYLEKESSSVLKYMQKRYFAIRGEGQFLIWFKKKPVAVDENPKGIIKISEIVSVDCCPDDEDQFVLKYAEREFLLRARSQDLRNRWVQSLQLILANYRKLAKNRKKDSTSTGQVPSADMKPESWRYMNVGQDINHKVRVENERMLLSEGENNIFEKSFRMLSGLLPGLGEYSDIEKNAMHGFARRKGFISDSKKWYCIFSEFNLANKEDDYFNDKIRGMLANGKLPKVSPDGNSDDSESDEADSNKQSNHKERASSGLAINRVYEFDAETSELTECICVEQIASWTLDTSQQPFTFTIKYQVASGDGIEEEEKELVISSEYLIEIQKWSKGIEIIYERYSVAKTRADLQQNKFQRFAAKSWKILGDKDWKSLNGESDKSQCVLLNKRCLKITGYEYLLVDINECGSEKIEEQMEDKTVKTQAVAVKMRNETLLLVFADANVEKDFRKKVKKFKKKLEEQKKEDKEIVVQEEVDLSTYHVDKKIRENSAAIKINFYEVMQRPVEPRRSQDPKELTFWDKVMAVFCVQSQDDLLFP